MRKTFLIIVSILGLCIATLIFVYSIVWLAFDDFLKDLTILDILQWHHKLHVYCIFIILYRNESFY